MAETIKLSEEVNCLLLDSGNSNAKIKAKEIKSVSVKITAPICSKTRAFINNAGISINNINF
ncbi:MAG: hypothetical protein U9N31_05310 [Candidatus Marinimicrobia bacterium]|nr:hypothetical protein [Candidatus Neomarinimicrobiota bacterium]